MYAYCNICGRPLHERFVLYRRRTNTDGKGLVVCRYCEQTAARCKLCRIPIHHSKISSDGLCLTCAAMTPRCNTCGGRIVGRYYQKGNSGNRYCEVCFNHRPRCSVCSGVVGTDGVKFYDGRILCAECHSTAICDLAQAQELYDRVVQTMETELGLCLIIRPELQLVDRRQMEALLAQTKSEVQDDPERVFGLFHRHGRKRFIYTQSGLPQIMMVQVVSHEYAHAWQGEMCPLLRDPLVVEGFAEWVAYKVLMAMGAVKKAALMKQRTDLYGKGLQIMITLEEQNGLQAVYGLCRSSDVPNTEFAMSLQPQEV